MNRTESSIVSIVASAIVGFTMTSPLLAADITVGAAVPAANQVPLAQIDHAAWDSLVRKYVDARGMVRYTTWKASASDSRALDDYLKRLSTSNLRGTREERLAFWINAYNALTIKGILREYPTSSIRNHTARLFGYNIWKNLKLIVAGKRYSLGDIENNVLRKMNEPRIHFAIVCASIGCPRLLNEAYRSDSLDEQLTRNSRAFFADASKFRYDSGRKAISVSPILKWYAEDFGKTHDAQLKRIAPWLPDAASQQLATAGSASVSYLEYDWGLNDRK